MVAETQETTYEVIKRCMENGSLKKLYKKNIVSFTWVVHKDIYEHLLNQIDKCEKEQIPSPVSQAVHNTSAHFGISKSSVWRLKKAMES